MEMLATKRTVPPTRLLLVEYVAEDKLLERQPALVAEQGEAAGSQRPALPPLAHPGRRRGGRAARRVHAPRGAHPRHGRPSRAGESAALPPIKPLLAPRRKGKAEPASARRTTHPSGYGGRS